jgi:hypothetical protein
MRADPARRAIRGIATTAFGSPGEIVDVFWLPDRPGRQCDEVDNFASRIRHFGEARKLHDSEISRAF